MTGHRTVSSRQGNSECSGQDGDVAPVSLDALMTLALQGDEVAYRRVLDEVARRMRRLIQGRAPWLQPADVEDVVQDTLMSLHMARATWDPARPFVPWIAAIARNRLADHARRFGRRSALDVAMQDFAETFGTARTNDHAQTVVDFVSVNGALSELTPAEREALEMLRLRQLSLVEAAAESGSSVTALKVAVHRASKRLRDALARDK